MTGTLGALELLSTAPIFRRHQLDHFFVSGMLAPAVRSCTVVDDDVVRRASDHAPIAMEIAIP